MTLQRSAQLSFAALALSLGVSVVPTSAHADQAITSNGPARVAFVSVDHVSSDEAGDDPLVPFATEALEAWQRFGSTGDQKALAEFNGLRSRIATEAAARVGADAATMRGAWAKADREHQVALMVAFTQLGTPYRSFKRIPGKGFDCSGFTSWVWAQTGVQLERSSRQQIRTVTNVDRTEAQAGDLVYYPGHISLYLGVDNFIIHSPQTGRSVEVSHTRHSVRFANPVA